MRGDDKHSPREALGTALFVTSFSALVGGYAGLTESSILLAAGNTTMAGSAVVNVAVLYGLMFGCVGLVIGLVSLVLDAISGWRSRSERTRALLGGMMCSFVVLVLVGGYANELFLPEMISTQALIVDGGLLIGCGLLWGLLYRVNLKRMETHRSARWWRSPTPWAWLCLVLILVVTGISSSGPAAGRASSERSHASKDLNVLLLVIDALRFDHLGAYGYERETSPNLDRLASEGVLFLNAYSQGSRTKESTASLVTSLYPSSHGVSNIVSAISESCPTLMTEMQAAGYRTAVFSANPLVSPAFGFGHGTDHFYCEAPRAERMTIVPHILRKPTLRLGRLLAIERKLESLLPMQTDRAPFAGGGADILNAELLQWIDDEPGTAFFAYVHYMEPHTPYDPPPPYDRLFDPAYEGERLIEPPLPPGLTAVAFAEGSRLPPREFENLVAQYDGSIAFVDQEIERLTEELRSRGLADNTLVVITSDHGEELYDHGGWSHGHTVYEELVRIPLIVWCPSLVPGGRVVEGVARHVDIMPTILAAGGLEPESMEMWFEGVNLWPFVRGGSDPCIDLPALSEVCSAGSSARSLRIGDMKIIQVLRGSVGENLLFDVSVDPKEQSDLAAMRPEVLQSMLTALEQMITESVSRKQTVRTGTIDERTRRRLASLGYVM